VSPAIHVRDCSKQCGGTYVCPRCDRTFGWCIGSHDDTPALCDDCANVVQAQWEKKPYAPPVLRSLGSVNRMTAAGSNMGHRHKPHG
jgi:hypothetical protein